MSLTEISPAARRQEHESWAVHRIGDGVTVTATISRRRRNAWIVQVISSDCIARTIASSYAEAREYITRSLLYRCPEHACGNDCQSYRMADLKSVPAAVDEQPACLQP